MHGAKTHQASTGPSHAETSARNHNFVSKFYFGPIISGIDSKKTLVVSVITLFL